MTFSPHTFMIDLAIINATECLPFDSWSLGSHTLLYAMQIELIQQSFIYGLMTGYMV